MRFSFASEYLRRYLAGNHIHVRKRHIGIGDNGICHMRASVFKPDTLRLATLDQDFIDLRTQVDFPAHFGNEVNQTFDDGAGPTHSIVHTPLPLQVVNHGINGGRIKGITPHQQGVERETLPEEIVFHKL